jgi:Vacuolar protein sorting-associated protein 62
VQIVLGNPEVSLRGPGSGSPVAKTAPTAADLIGMGADYFLDFPGNPLSPGCTYEKDGKRFAAGQPAVAYAHITTEDGAPGKLALEYWFYYYFNDFNNKHESDWEGIQLIFDADTVEEALLTAPTEVGFAQHEGGEWANWGDDKLEKVGDHPVVYPAAGSHASYYSDRLWLGRAASEGIGCDNSTGPSHQVPLAAVVVPTEPLSREGNLAWLGYEGLWGQREQGPNAGPTGPNTKDRWTRPITWQEGLRGGSVAVPGLPTFGPSVSGAFCGGIGFAAGLYIDYLSSPVVTILVIVAVVGLVALLVWRTRWRPARAEPIREQRGIGQILLSSGRIYARHPLRYVAISSLFLWLEGAAVGVSWLLGVLLSDVRLRISLTGLSTILASAAIALVLRNLDSGRSLGCVKAYRFVLRRFWSLIGAAAITTFVQLLIALTVVGIPIAVYRFIRRVFVLVEVVLHGHSARSSQGASVAVVRGHWWRTALLVGLLYLILIGVGPVVGFVLLFKTRLSPELIDAIGSVIYMVVFPYAAIAATLLYFDLLERRREAREPS